MGKHIYVTQNTPEGGQIFWKTVEGTDAQEWLTRQGLIKLYQPNKRIPTYIEAEALNLNMEE